MVRMVEFVMVRGGSFPKHTAPADQSEHIVLFRRRGFIETETKQSVTDRLGREELRQWRICFLNIQILKPILIEP